MIFKQFPNTRSFYPAVCAIVAVLSFSQVSAADEQLGLPKPLIREDLKVWTFELSAAAFGGERLHNSLTITHDGTLIEKRSPFPAPRLRPIPQKTVKAVQITPEDLAEVFSAIQQLFNGLTFEIIREGRTDHLIYYAGIRANGIASIRMKIDPDQVNHPRLHDPLKRILEATNKYVTGGNRSATTD